MAIKLNRAQEIMDRLEREGKVRVMDDCPEFRKRQKERNKYMEEVRRECNRISFNSWIAASKLLLT
ncbi:hypothetical protein SAMN04488128_104392 [Chitinophaga eiseniae]|uniref:Uncharacterized protein n=1 Tax=Chitinophaga eiseniae TaxID=634771 RepID=A0A1T4TCB6_9BACT|nr:hypothetical protein [Chitinophaga eiseniae]SKA38132.1 hypothetical protein SAMN04488128_104392 [Chitinophaga eiseniae]